MQYALVFGAAALAQLTSAHEARHGRLHKRAVVTDVEIDYVTVTETVTAGASAGAQQQWYHSWSHGPQSSSAASSEAAPTSAPAPSSYSAPSSSEAAPASSEAPSSAAPSSTLVTSVSSAASSPANYNNAGDVASSSYASSTAASSSAAPTSSSSSSLTPGGKKAGLSGYVGIQDIDAFGEFAPYISWYSDYTANTPDSQGVQGVGMVWAAQGSSCSLESERLATFTDLTNTPSIMFGFYEPDCNCPDSAQMDTASAASAWDSLLAPLADKGTVLGSPPLCKQSDEDFLTPFKDAISGTWDVTSVHINKPNATEAQKVVEYYVNTYGKKVWVSEFACVDDQPSWNPCTDQDQINSYINDVVAYFEGNDDVVAYGPSNGAGLGDVWPLTDSSTGELTPSGQTYLNAIKGL